MHQLVLEPRPGTCVGGRGDGRQWVGGGGNPEPRVGHTPGPAPSPHAGLLSPSQVRGASEEPGQFSLTNAAGTHTTSEGVSSPAPGELVFSSFHNLLAGPYFWSLPPRFRGDKVGRGAGKSKGTLGSRDSTGKGSETRASGCLRRKEGRRDRSGGGAGPWGLR